MRSEDLVQKIFEGKFPEDRKIVSTMDRMKWWKVDVVERKLFVPPLNAIKREWGLLDTFIDACRGFAHIDLDNFPKWDNTTYEWDQGNEEIALQLIDKVRYLGELNTYVSSDIETRHVQFLGNKILAVGFCAEDNVAIIITNFSETVKSAIQRLFDMPEIKWIYHNGKFDTRILKYCEGIEARVDEDTILMHYVGINEKRGTHGLKDLGRLFVYAPAWEDELDRFKKTICKQRGIKLKEFKYDMFPRDILIKYLHFDVIVTRKLFFVFKDIMRPEANFIYRKLIEASNVYRDVEINGVVLDLDYLDDLEYELAVEIDQAGEHLKQEVARVWNPIDYMRVSGAKSLPKMFNMKSPQQLKYLMNKVLQGTGEVLEDTKADTLDHLFERVGDQFPVVNAIRDLRRLNKWMDTYVQGYQTLLAEDGRIHCDFKLHGTETGRLSSSDPNMQNIPRNKRIKNLFVAAEGKIYLQLDYSQAELRVLAYLSGDKFLTNVYVSGEDLHDAVATQMFGHNFTKEQRVLAKTINFGIVYGRGPQAIAEKFGISFGEAKALVMNWFKQMPEVDAWIKSQKAMALRNEVPTTCLGRERHFVITEDKLYHIQNEYVNFPVQSLASDMTVFSLIDIHNIIQDNGWQDRVKICINVHDSIILEMDDDAKFIQEVARVCIRAMELAPMIYLPECNVPFVADAEIGYKWGEMKALELGDASCE